ncbi:MAG: 16S rRNA processing protein RimM [Alphaproteobacteria bacterium]|jgi:16S rRNA processing protein RimM|nr:16S rRNA processing protein RimM [Alphaproteobacteria bacterium]
MSGRGGDRLIVVGAIAGAHGVRGDVRVKSFTADPEDCFAYGPLLGDDGAVLVEAASVRPAKSHFIVTPKQECTREAWDALKGTPLHVLRSALPDTGENEFYVEDLVGLTVYAGGSEPVGRVKAVQDFGASDLIEVQPIAGGKSRFVPFTLEDVPMVDLEAGRLTVADWALWADDGDA